MAFDSLQNLTSAILKKKARIATLEAILNRQPSYYPRASKPSMRNRMDLAEEQQHLLFTVAELEQEKARMLSRLSARDPKSHPAAPPANSHPGTEAPPALPVAHQHGDMEAPGALPQNETDVVAACVARKLANPDGFPTMTVKEVKHALGISKSTIYRRLDEGKLERASLNHAGATRKAVRIRTASVKRALEQAAD